MTALLQAMRSWRAGPILLMLAVALVVGVPTVVLGEIAAEDTRHRVRDAQLLAQRSAVERVDSAITANIAAVRYFLGHAARPARGQITPLARASERGDTSAIDAELLALSRVAPAIVFALALYDPDGAFKRAVGGEDDFFRSPAQRADALPIRAEQVGVRQLTTTQRNSLAQSGGAVALGPFDPLVLGRAGRKMPVGIAVAGSGPPAGYLFAEVNLSFLGSVVLEAGSAVGEIYIVDRDGRLLRRLSRTVTDTEVGRDLSSAAVVGELAAGRRVHGEAADPLGGGLQLISTRTTGPLVGLGGALELDLGWHVIAARPVALVYSDVESALAQFRIVRLALLGLLLAGAFALGVSLQKIRRQRRQLESANRHKSEFLANMSHELRTPLNAVIGFSDVLLQRIAGPISEKQAEYLGDIRASGRHLLALINDLLDLSKIEAGRMEIQLAAFSLPATLTDALTMVRERAGERGVALGLEIAPEVGVITADERKVRQVVANLLSNAVKFTPDGGRVAVQAVRQGEEIRVAVQDTGVGIALEDQARIFEEFEQAKHGRDAAEGTGLGLSLSKRIIELHGGRIWVESEVGRGSTFTFALPLLPAGKEG